MHYYEWHRTVGRRTTGRQGDRTQDRRAWTNCPMKVRWTSNEPSSQRWQCYRLQCCNSDGTTARNVAIVVAAMALRCAALLQQLCNDGVTLRGAAIAIVQWWRYCSSCVVMARSYDAVVARRCDAVVVRRCDAAATMVLWHCCYSDGAVAKYYLFIYLFFVLESFRRENESEKEKKEQDLKLVSRLYWLAWN